MRIFVTGATGVVGSRVVPLLVSAGHQVTAVGRTPEKRKVLERMGATSVEADLFSPDSLRPAVAGHDVVINLATSIPPTSRMFLPGAWHETDRIRTTGSANLVDAAIAGGVTRFIQESFAPIYPDSGDAWIDESVSVQPVSYNRSVLDAEASAERFTQTGRTGVVLRFAAFYGSDPQTQDIVNFARRGWALIPGSPDAFFPAVSHEDAASAVVAALNILPGIYNVVDDEPLRRREYFSALAQALGVAPPKLLPAWAARLFGPLGETLSRSLRISNRKLRTTSGWSPKYPSVREGWQAVVTSMRKAA
jgi:nucleoside-diphosphate-sugar epimerase